MRKKNKRRSQARPGNFQKGLYLDFEGYSPHSKQSFRPPSLCGYRHGVEGPVTQVVFSQSLKWAAIDSGLEVLPWKEFLQDLLLKKKHGLYAFSEHEKNLIEKATGWSYDKSYRNVRAIAKYGLRGQVSKDCRTLVDFCRAAGITVPTGYGKGSVTKWMTEVRKHSGTKAGWAKAPARVKRAWHQVLDHNSFDVTCMPELVGFVDKLKVKAGDLVQ